MTLFQIEKWDTRKNGPVSLEKIRELFRPSYRYRISQADYPADSEFPESRREGICYILRGEVTYFAEKVIALREGDFVTLPEGTYLIRVGANGPVSMVNVWELPISVRPH